VRGNPHPPKKFFKRRKILMRFNLLIDGMNDTIHCMGLTEETAWAIIKARYETLEEEEVWVYLDDSSFVSSVNAMKRSDNCFSMATTYMEASPLATIRYKFDKIIKEIEEG
jgi:hypothetical protein